MVTNNAVNNATATTGTVLQGAGVGTASTYSTATYPSTTTINQVVYSSAANTVTGLATANSGVLTTSTTGVPSIDTTNFHVLTTGVQVKGNGANTAPPAGFIGEQIRSYNGGGISLSTGVSGNVTTISLTTGIWDISGIVGFVPGATTITTSMSMGISATSATLNVLGDDSATFVYPTGLTNFQNTLSVPSFRVTLASTTTYYLVSQSIFTVSTQAAYGRISATRVG